MSPLAGPLTDADLAELKVKLSELDQADKLIEQAKRAGIDVEPQLQRAKELRDKLQRLKQAFWPGQ
jgi:phage terminase large subunit-like protein